MSGSRPGDATWLLSLVRTAVAVGVLVRAARDAARGRWGRAAYFAVLGVRQGLQGGARLAGGPAWRGWGELLDRVADPGHAATMLPVALSRRHRSFALRAALSSATWWVLDRAAREGRGGRS